MLAVDLGTSGPKVALVSTRGDVAASASEPVSLHLLPEGGAEQDPAEWWAAVTAAARSAVAQGGIAPERIVAVACTAQWAGHRCDRRDRKAPPAGGHLDGLAGEPGHPQAGAGQGVWFSGSVRASSPTSSG